MLAERRARHAFLSLPAEMPSANGLASMHAPATDCVALSISLFVLVFFSADKPPGDLSAVETPATQPRGELPAPTRGLQLAVAGKRPYGIEERTLWTHSRVVGSPEPPLPYRLVRSFARLTFEQPVYMIPEPGSNRIFLVEYGGKILTFEEAADAEQTSLFRDMQRNTYSITFHPDYVKNGFVYVFSNGPKSETQRGRHNRISRFRTTGDSPRRCIPDSETIILEWASAGHDGGDMAFGPDGYLYITAGDGTGDSDTNNTGQDITDLPAAVLRIDVDHPDDGRAYGIPHDNPFVYVEESRPEIWAFGFRNPWRMSFDPPTDRLWVGDVGQDLWELVHLVRRGANYGWSVYEGSHPFYPKRTLGSAEVVKPVVEHPHSEARSITGGLVYRGSRLPELAGAYIYCCYETGKVWGLRYEDGEVTWHEELADSTYKVVSFGRDHAGELYLIDYGGEILRLEPTPSSQQGGGTFPRKLSQTGLYESVATHAPAPGVIPYSVNAPVWADGARLERLLAIPGDGRINMTDTRGWNLPEGTVLAQTVSLNFDADNTVRQRRIETRLLTRQQGEWRAYTYAWNDDQTDADLVDRDGDERTFVAHDSASPGGPRRRTWRFYSRDECMMCHSRAANYILGLSTLQMNTLHDYGGVVDNQLRTFNHIDLFDEPLEKSAAEIPSLPNPFDPAEPIERRARAYLHANCAHCHVVAGGGNAKIELDFTADRAKTNLFDVVPLHGRFEIADCRLVAPGDPYRSVLLYRIAKLGRGRMPHIGSRAVDHKAVHLFYDWIERLPVSAQSPEQTIPRYVLKSQQRQALQTLIAGDEPAGAAGLRNSAIDTLLSTTSGAMRVLRAALDGNLDSSAQDMLIQAAASHASPSVRDLFEQFLPEEQRQDRLGTKFDPVEVLSLQGNAERGERLFFEGSGVQCRNCHRINGRGKELGPDLSKIAQKNDASKLLESIVEPSKEVDSKYAALLLQTTDGRVHTGLLVEKSTTHVVLKDNQHTLIRVPSDQVALLVAQKKSLMPELLLRDMTAQQVADLLAYLSSLR